MLEIFILVIDNKRSEAKINHHKNNTLIIDSYIYIIYIEYPIYTGYNKRIDRISNE